MLLATNEFKHNLENGYPLYGSCKIILADNTVIELSKDDFLKDNQGFSIQSSTSSQNTFDIGSVSASELTLKIINYDGHLNDYDFESAIVSDVFINMEKSDGTIESIPKGFFKVDSQDFNGGIVTLKAYDTIGFMNDKYSGSSSGTVQVLVQGIADKYNITLKDLRFNNYDFYIDLGENTDRTDREILSYLMEITCNYAIMDSNGYLLCAWYGDTEENTFIDAQSFKNPSEDYISAGDVSEMLSKDIISAGVFSDIGKFHHINSVFSTRQVGIADILITGIKVIDNEDNEYNAGEDGYMLTIDGNPLVNASNAQEIANRVWQVAQLTRFRTMQVEILNNPLYEVGDCVFVKIKDNYYETLITNLNYAVGCNTTITVGADTPSKNASYSNVVSTAVKKVVKQSANQVSALSSQFANLITQSLGMFEIHETQADGSTITYLASKPTLADSIGGTVWRMALNVFTVTSNYQGEATVWESGFDSQGNLKANVLEVVGIKFDWAKGGTLELGGLNNGNGLLRVLDSNGNNIANMSKDGVNINSGSAGKWNITKDYLEFVGTSAVSFTYGGGFYIDENGTVVSSSRLIRGFLSTRIQEGVIEFGYYKYNADGSKGDYVPMTRLKNAKIESYQTDTQTWSEVVDYSRAAGFKEMSSNNGYFQICRAVNVQYDNLSQLSSIKYKENIISMNDDDSQKILELKPCHFDYIKGHKNRSGMIAEEVVDILPECVTYNTEDNSILGLDYTKFIPYMIKTIQYQEERIKALEKKLESEGK